MHWFYSCHPRHRWILIIPNGVKSNETKLYSRIQYTSIAKCVKVYESYNMTHIIWVEWIPWDFLIFDTEHITKIWLVCDVWNVPRIILQKKKIEKKLWFSSKIEFSLEICRFRTSLHLPPCSDLSRIEAQIIPHLLSPMRS